MGRATAKYACVLLAATLASAVPPLLARKKDKASVTAGNTAGDQRRALHALNRLTFGPRPGDVQRILAIGVDQWIDQQLHPEKIDDSALDARLQPFRTLRMSTREIAEDFPDNQLINQVKDGKRSMPSDAALRMIYQVQIARSQEKKQAKENEKDKEKEREKEKVNLKSAGKAAADGGDSLLATVPAAKATPGEEERIGRGQKLPYADELEPLLKLPPDQRFNQILSLSPAAQLAFADSIRGGKGQGFLEGLSSKQKETLLAMNNPAGVVTGELTQAKLLRAIYTERQLDEVMTDFWFNHFNVFADKGLDRLFVTSYERDVIRPHALGKFEDLLVATARSPAMLFYLDNSQSVGPNSAQALGLPARPHQSYPRPRPDSGKRSGLNENYGRELLELHTLSVNGGYSQRDVTEVAKVFTGWTIDKPAEGGGFKFDPRTHEPGPKLVLGRKIKFKGEGEGMEVLHRLARSPMTAHFISLKLAQRFVSDDPPPELVDRMAKTFLKKKGDIREVLVVLFRSPEFWDDAAYRAKVKTPLEFVASAARATGADIEDAQPLARQLSSMAMPLYGAQPPTGYSMKSDTWVSSSSLLNRMNFALALTNGKIKGTRVDVATLTRNDTGSSPPLDAEETLSALENTLLDGDVSRQTHDSIAAQPKAEGKTMAGLLLGSPEFQRR